MYEKLFGGFEDLATTAAEDEEEPDDLAYVPSHKKTKDGYLKDGFVVESGSDNASSEDGDEDEDDDEDGDEDDNDDNDETDGLQDELVLEDIGSELSSEDYTSEEE